MAELHIPSRPFGGAAQDLELDFESGDRPALVTALLAACMAPPDEQLWWRLPVSERIAALLALLRETEHQGSLNLALRCDSCEKPFEIDLPHEAFAGLRTRVEDVQLSHAGSEPLVLRVPTGNDLRAWHSQMLADHEQAAAMMVSTLRVAGEIQPGDPERASRALAEADPLVSFSVTCSCPSCGVELEPAIDLEAAALQRLAVRQRALLREVLALASRFGWSEREIFEVPPARRAKYLQLIGEIA